MVMVRVASSPIRNSPLAIISILFGQCRLIYLVLKIARPYITETDAQAAAFQVLVHTKHCLCENRTRHASSPQLTTTPQATIIHMLNRQTLKVFCFCGSSVELNETDSRMPIIITSQLKQAGRHAHTNIVISIRTRIIIKIIIIVIKTICSLFVFNHN